MIPRILPRAGTMSAPRHAVSDRVVGLTIVAAGTSMSEAATSLSFVPPTIATLILSLAHSKPPSPHP